MRKSPVERLAARSREAVCFTRGLDLPCWVYTGSRDAKGYSTIRVDGGRTSRGHRVAYLGLIGPIPEGLEPDHLCRNRACWNPWHLDLVTHAVNVKRGRAGAVIRARAAQITHCPQGHVYEGDNDRRNKRGKRYCLACARDRERRKREVQGAGTADGAQLNAAKTHCPQGHPYDAENTYVTRSGGRGCRVCRKESVRRFKEQRANEPAPVSQRKTHCVHGHAYTPENTYVDPLGYRYCRTCSQEAGRRYRARKAAD